jgi:hypothetical protein
MLRITHHQAREKNFPKMHKRIFSSMAALVICAWGSMNAATIYHVSVDGHDDKGDGSIHAPWKSIDGARNGIRKSGANRKMKDDLIVMIHGGRYELNHTIHFDSNDSASNGKSIIYQASPHEMVRISGGKEVTGWERVPGSNLWRANVSPQSGFPRYFRQLYINGIRADRARSDWMTGQAYYQNPATPQSIDGISFRASDVKPYQEIQSLRLFHVSSFKIDEFPIVAIHHDKKNGRRHIQLQQPYCQIRHDRKSGYFDANDQWMILGAKEDMDEPGEWYHDEKNHVIYYYPYSFQDMNRVEAYLPNVETLISLQGTASAKIHHIQFVGLIFEHGHWLFPKNHYIGGIQAEMIMDQQASGIDQVPSQIVLNQTQGIIIKNNTFRHLANGGIHLYNHASNTLIEGNIFYDLSSSAIMCGRWKGNIVDNDIPDEGHSFDNIARNNLIRGIGYDFAAATGINHLSGSHFQVIHNDVADTSYMGIHQRNQANTTRGLPGVGKSVISGNRVTLANAGTRYGVGDSGYIYTFGSWPGSVIEKNYIHNIDQGNASGLYLDNDTAGFLVRDNVIENVPRGQPAFKLIRSVDPSTVISHDNYSNSPYNIFRACKNQRFHEVKDQRWPATAQSIMKESGLQPAFQHLLKRLHDGRNLARGKSISSSSHASQHAASCANDGDIHTCWLSDQGDDALAWWLVDLQSPHVIQRIEIGARADVNDPAARCHFAVQASNDPQFKKFVVLAEQNEVPFSYRTTGLTNSWLKYVNVREAYRYLRVIKTQNGPLSISECQIHGYREQR